MALARIITRSHQYAQQLALDLLARGYAVEVVSPDAIPANPADLELRVEASATESQGHVTEIREQGTSKSIEYLQRLKPMMADLLRKWPASGDAKSSASDRSAGFNFNSEAESSADVELPKEYQRPFGSAPMTSRMPDLESARLVPSVSRANKQKPASADSSIFSITGEPISWDESDPERGGRSEVWFWRAALGFAGMALLILVLGMALRKSPSMPAQAAAPAEAQTVAATQPPQPMLKPSPSVVASSPAKAAVVPTAATAPAVAKAKPSGAVHASRLGLNNEVGNRDTTVTYFNTKATQPPPKPAQNQESGIKHYSDMD